MALDTSAYERQRREVNTSYAANTAANEYGRFVAQQRGARMAGDGQRNFGRGWPKQAAGWGQRGHNGARVNSGFYQNAMQNYVADYQRQQNDFRQDYANEMTQFDQSAARMEAQRQQALAEIEMDKQRQIAMLAQNIQAIKPGIGG